jgi:hypothetical protein
LLEYVTRQAFSGIIAIMPPMMKIQSQYRSAARG